MDVGSRRCCGILRYVASSWKQRLILVLKRGEGGYVWASWRWHQFNLGDIKALMLGNLEYMKAAGGAGKPGSPRGNQKSFLMF